MKKRIGYILFLALITPVCFEIALRILGYTPFIQEQYYIVSKPDMCLKSSADLGFTLGEGVYEVSMNGAPAYTATHRNGRRITKNHVAHDSLRDVFIMGCSFTYGMGVVDSVSFPHQIQRRFPQLDVHNFGVPGFGTVQSYLQLKKEIENGNIPDLVLVNFCDFHHERNSLTPIFRKSLVLGYERSNTEAERQLAKSKFPYIKNGKLASVDYTDLYTNWIGRETFAAVQYFQSISDKRAKAKLDLEANSETIFRKMHALCDEHHIHFAVTGLTQTSATYAFLERLVESSGIHTIDIALDLAINDYNQLPYDSHPNEKAHDFFAKKISEKIALWIAFLEAN